MRVDGDREHPLSEGYTCPKGRALGALHHHPKRLDGPLLRRNGRLVPVSWDELLDDLAARIGDAVGGRGPSAVGAYFGTGATFDANLYWAGGAFLKKLGSPAKFTSGTVDAPSYPVVRRLMSGVGWLFHGIDFERATLTLLLGTNPVVSHTSHMQSYPNPTSRLRALAARGRALGRRLARDRDRAARDASPGHPARHRLRAPRLPRPRAPRRGRGRRVPRRARERRRRARRRGAAVRADPRGRAHGARGGRAHRPPRRRAPPRAPRAPDGHRDVHVAGGEPHPVALARAARGHRLARAAGWRVVQPRLHPGPRQAARPPRPAARAGPGEPPRASVPGRRVPVDHDRRRARGREPAGALRARREPPRGAPRREAHLGCAPASAGRRRLGRAARRHDRARDARLRGRRAVRAGRSAALLRLPLARRSPRSTRRPWSRPAPTGSPAGGRSRRSPSGSARRSCRKG